MQEDSRISFEFRFSVSRKRQPLGCVDKQDIYYHLIEPSFEVSICANSVAP